MEKLRGMKRKSEEEGMPPAEAYIYFSQLIHEIIRNLIHELFNDPQYLRLGAHQHRVVQDVVVVLTLCILRECVVSRDLLGHRDDECGGTRRRDEGDGVTRRTTSVRALTQR